MLHCLSSSLTFLSLRSLLEKHLSGAAAHSDAGHQCALTSCGFRGQQLVEHIRLESRSHEVAVTGSLSMGSPVFTYSFESFDLNRMTDFSDHLGAAVGTGQGVFQKRPPR